MALSSDENERILLLETSNKYINTEIASLHNKIDQFIAEVRGKGKEDHFTRKDVITLVFGAVATCAVCFGGFNYLVDSRLSPVHGRLDTFQDSIRSLRESATAMQTAIASTNVELSKDRKTLNTLEQLNLGALNATQDSSIRTNANAIQEIKARLDRWDERYLDKLEGTGQGH